MSDYTIEYLADYPEYIEACAAWDYGYWEIQENGRSLEEMIEVYKEGAQKNALPLTLIAIQKKDVTPVGIASLWEEDGDEWPDIKPWIASVFVHHRHRGRGVAKQLVTRAEEEAAKLNLSTIHLKSGDYADMYRRWNYKEIDSQDMDKYSSARKILFKKDLT